MPERRPLVAVAGVLDLDRPQTFISHTYVEAVLQAGGLPIVVPPALHAAGAIDQLLDGVDALLIPGGRDLDTARLGIGPVHPAARLGPTAQQDADVALVLGALKRDLPILGICYGMQLLGVLGGAPLHQHLPDVFATAEDHFDGIHSGLRDHDVRVEPGSALGCALGLPDGGVHGVHSGHHQALAEGAPGWRITARSPDGVVEAIESDGRRFAVGVQWHPERAIAGSRDHGLFRAFVAAAA
jgi:putative glutamine amidotransferase